MLLQLFLPTRMRTSGELANRIRVSANETVRAGSKRLKSKIPANQVVARGRFLVVRRCI
jgi:hypothetical protein